MYARFKNFPNKDGTQRTYLQIVESYRVGGKCRQRVVANLGRLEELQEGQLDRLIDSLARYSKSLYLKLNEAKPTPTGPNSGGRRSSSTTSGKRK